MARLEQTVGDQWTLGFPSKLIVNLLCKLDDIHTVRDVLSLPGVLTILKDKVHYVSVTVPRDQEEEDYVDNLFFNDLRDKVDTVKVGAEGETERSDFGFSPDSLINGHIYIFDLQCSYRASQEQWESLQSVLETKTKQCLKFIAFNGFTSYYASFRKQPLYPHQITDHVPSGTIIGVIHKDWPSSGVSKVTPGLTSCDASSRFNAVEIFQFQEQVPLYGAFEYLEITRAYDYSDYDLKGLEKASSALYRSVKFNGVIGKLAFTGIGGGEYLKTPLKCSQLLITSSRDLEFSQFFFNPRYKIAPCSSGCDDELGGIELKDIRGSVTLKAYYAINNVSLTASQTFEPLKKYGIEVSSPNMRYVLLSVAPSPYRFKGRDCKISNVNITGFDHLAIEYTRDLPELDNVSSDVGLTSISITGNKPQEPISGIQIQAYSSLVAGVKNVVMSCTCLELLSHLQDSALESIEQLMINPYSGGIADETESHTICLEDMVSLPNLKRLVITLPVSDFNFSTLLNFIEAPQLRTLHFRMGQKKIYIGHFDLMLNAFPLLEELRLPGFLGSPIHVEISKTVRSSLKNLQLAHTPDSTTISSICKLCPEIEQWKSEDQGLIETKERIRRMNELLNKTTEYRPPHGPLTDMST